MTAKLSASQWPETMQMAFGTVPISSGMRARDTSRLASMWRMSGSQGQGPPPCEMKYVGSRAMGALDIPVAAGNDAG
jgi:hypothetical protein